MGKKRFSSGLDDLFSELHHEEPKGGAMSELSVSSAPERKHAPVKRFSNSIDALLQDALEESIQQFEARQQHTPVNTKSKSASKAGVFPRVSTGLDALIRETIDVKSFEKEEESGIKRLTVAVDRTKLDKLKTIARLENSYLKDLLVHLIDEYIEGYSEQKGFQL